MSPQFVKPFQVMDPTRNKKITHINIYLGSLKPAWLDYCVKLGKKPGAAVREAIQSQLLQAANKKTLAELEGCSPQKWLINIARAMLVRQPQFGMHELQKLGESNYQLLAIGRNLNQIAKCLNQGLSEPDLATIY